MVGVSVNNIKEIIKECIDIRKQYENNIEFDSIQNEYPILCDICSRSRKAEDCRIMIIARDLGRDEVLQKRPLIGRAGQIIREILKKFNISNEIYITNTIPYKPNNNISFSSDIRAEFKKILIFQLNLVNPKIIITLGKEALEIVMNRRVNFLKKTISDYYKEGRKNIQDLFIEKVMNSNINCYLLPALHPAYLLRLGIELNDINYDNIDELRKTINVFKLSKKLLYK